jgi:hypothetical protein
MVELDFGVISFSFYHGHLLAMTFVLDWVSLATHWALVTQEHAYSHPDHVFKQLTCNI